MWNGGWPELGSAEHERSWRERAEEELARTEMEMRVICYRLEKALELLDQHDIGHDIPRKLPEIARDL